MMNDQIVSVRSLLSFAAFGITFTTALSCPYARGNHAPALEARHIEARLSPPGPEFGRCPRKSNLAGGGTRSQDWWPCQLNLATLRQHGERSNPLGSDFDYATEFAKLDVAELKKDFAKVQVDSQAWWPADFGDYGPFFIRLSWHSAGTYRQADGRGGSGTGQQRFAPLNSWSDNASLDKARRLLWPIKQKYGNKLSWADLIAFAGHQSLENMGLPPFGFAFGRVDTWQADEAIFWGSEQEMFPGNTSNTDRYNGSTDIYGRADKLDPSLADTNMALIYVDPRGPNGIPDPKASALDIRTTFERMGMNDEETVALVAGGHAFGKAHGATKGDHIGPEPNQAPIEAQGFGWINSNPQGGSGQFAFTSGLEVIWSQTPTKWANHFLQNLFNNMWTLVKSPDGAPQWVAANSTESVPDAFIKGKFHRPTMLTSDLALIQDPIYHNISQRYLNDFALFTDQFNRAWFKLLHRDMGPRARYLGPDVPQERFIWQDPLPAVSYGGINDGDINQLKQSILAAPGLNVSNLVTTAWGSASSFRLTDKRGGANGARIALQPQRSFAANNPARIDTVITALREIQTRFNSANRGKQVSLADLIVLGGNAAVERAASAAGTTIKVPFTPGRVDATQNQTDVASFAFLEPKADGFRNFGRGNSRASTEEFLVDKANQLSLSPPELTVLVGGMRALDANFDGSKTGVLTNRPGQLTHDFFVNLFDMSTQWTAVANTNEELFDGKDATTGTVKYRASRNDLIFGSHPELRAIGEVYGASDAQTQFVNDFAKAWTKVMELDRYDIKGRKQNNQQ